MSETTRPGTVLIRMYGNDSDSGENGRLTYSLASLRPGDDDAEYFSVDPATGNISLRMILDRERKATLQLLMTARDNGLPQLSSTKVITAVVVDFNDNAPAFDIPFGNSMYEAVINHLATRGQFVTVVKAFDRDAADATKLRYVINDGNEDNTFTMDPASGIISLSQTVAHPLQPTYFLTVSVTDGVHMTSTKVKLSTQFTNRFVPVFSQEVYDVDVTENLPAGSVVTTVTASDQDDEGSVTFSIADKNLMDVFDVHRSTGKCMGRTIIISTASRLCKPLMLNTHKKPKKSIKVKKSKSVGLFIFPLLESMENCINFLKTIPAKKES